jgi:hypothetical protein
MRTVLPIALVMTMMACHQARVGPEPSRHKGEYAFRISFVGRDPVTGVLSITADTVLLETSGQGCRHDPFRVGAENLHSFSCFPPPGIEKFAMVIDPNHPALSRWTASQSVQKERKVCARYVANSRGQTVCAETRTETYFETVSVGGRLNFTAVDTVRTR